MDQEQRVIRTDDNKMVDVKDMPPRSLTDAFSLHAKFVRASVVMVSECCGPESSMLGGDGAHFQYVLDEVETRIGYLEAIHHEMYARLQTLEKEKAA